MKRQNLKFGTANMYRAPKIISRRMRLTDVAGRSVCYESDAPPGDPDPDAAEKAALLAKVKETITAECAAKGYQNAEQVQAAFKLTLEGLDLASIKKFQETEKVAMQQSIKNMAGAIEKLQMNPIMQEAAGRKLNAIKELLGKKETMDAIQMAMKKGNRNIVTLNTQAAVAVMTTANVVDDGDIPEDILNSFSVDAFVKKRRPKEYIYDIASRRTVAEITEYKTWLEEGDEQGAFAIVEQGAVKPLMSKTLVRQVVKYKKAAGKRVYTEEFAKFRKEAYNIIEDLFNDQLLRNYAAILMIDLIAAAASYVGTALDATFTNPTDYHAIGAVAAQIETLEFMPDLLIINPQDKWRINLSQDTTGQFYVGIPKYNAATGAIEMMGFRIFTTNRIDVGTFMLGEAGLFKIEDEPVTIRMGSGINVTKDEDGFVTDVDSDIDTNRFRIIAETFFRDWIATSNTGSFVIGNFADIKEALLLPAI